MAIFEFDKEIVLEDEVALLRPLRLEDIEVLGHFALNQPEIWLYSQLPANSMENMRQYINLAVQGRRDQKSYAFVVYDKRTKEYAGSTRYYDYQVEHQTVQLGYTWYGKEFQGTGINKHCKYLMLQFAFETLGLQRVEFRADARNARSIAAMKSLGCKVEGILRSNLKAPSGRRDSIVLSILKEEWFSSAKETIREKMKTEKNK